VVKVRGFNARVGLDVLMVHPVSKAQVRGRVGGEGGGEGRGGGGGEREGEDGEHCF